MKSQIELLLFGRISRRFFISTEDLQYWERVKSGSTDAFSTLFRKYYRALYFFAGRFVHDPGYAENLVQDVFVRFWENREKINVDTSLKSYLYSSVKNACLNAVKQESRHSSLDDEEESHVSRDSSPAEKLEDAELKRQLDEAIDKLPDKCREIFMMCKYDELSYKEIAEIQNISVNTVKTQLKRAMKSLSENLAYLKTMVIFLQFLVWNYFNK